MAMLIKYRVHEVAKDFNLTSKDISEILTKYATTPKNHMQVLETPELDLIFESLTQKNQVENLEELLTAKPKEEKKLLRLLLKKGKRLPLLRSRHPQRRKKTNLTCRVNRQRSVLSIPEAVLPLISINTMRSLMRS